MELWRFGIGADATEQRLGAYWLLRAAEQGHVEAQLALGQSYAFGSGVVGDVEQAAHWLEEAAKTEPEKASRHLALIYARGLGGLPIRCERSHGGACTAC